jgi:hypothetical protein
MYTLHRPTQWRDNDILCTRHLLYVCISEWYLIDRFLNWNPNFKFNYVYLLLEKKVCKNIDCIYPIARDHSFVCRR